ncbi:Poly(R)-hydroxyalkanoic acid synthase subunit (PHA_synth_III_E) [uncultured archaeon]|nr:Poly(R)-hydroxyalkanoic acid synthase subunit (PHA_synth_III_E) [uncultured archaeon]
MVSKSEQVSVESGEKKDIFRIWADSYTAVSRIWEDSYTILYKPWIESSGALLDKAAELSKEATAEKYREFYDEWMKSYQNTFGKFYPVKMGKLDREMVEKLKDSAEEAKNLFQSWVNLLEENARKTEELSGGEPDIEKSREIYNMWMNTYGKIFEDFLAMPTRGASKEVLESYGGLPNIYLRSFSELSKIWRDSYMHLYQPWADSMMKLSGKMTELSRGDASPEAYKEFYNLWMNTYKDMSGRWFNVESFKPSKEMFDSFLKSTDIYLNMYKSWISALEKMSEKTTELSKRTADPEAFKEFYNTWAKMNEKALEDFFKYMPAVGPMKNMMEPVKNATKAYADMFVNMSNAWMRMAPGATATSQV